MSDTPETLSAILAEMREISVSDWANLTPRLIHELADRIEAAAEREREAAQSAPGNAAAMRDALEWSMHEMCERCDSYMADNMQTHKPCPGCVIVDKARAALAAPPRNCDRFATAEEAYSAWMSAVGMDAICDWLFAPAKGGAVAAWNRRAGEDKP